MVEGLTIGRSGGGQASAGKKAASIELLAVHGALEVTQHRISTGKHFFLDEATEWSGFEFIYILSGRMTMTGGDEAAVLASGDYLYHRGLPERAYFRVEEEVRLLMVSSPPSFHLIKEEIQEMMVAKAHELFSVCDKVRTRHPR